MRPCQPTLQECAAPVCVTLQARWLGCGVDCGMLCPGCKAPAVCCKGPQHLLLLTCMRAWCRGVINRFGFNSAGVDVVGANLAAFRDRTNYEPARSLRPGLVGVNVGKNKVCPRQSGSCCKALSSSCSRGS